MTTRVLFFDTSAIIKIFLQEKGSDVVKWLIQTKATSRLHFVINEQVCKEFSERIKEFSVSRPHLNINAERILNLFFNHYVGCKFRVIGQEIISNTKEEQNLSIIIKELNLITGKNDWDALHYQSMVNALAFLGGESHPILVSGDNDFVKKVARKGYRVINLNKQSLKEVKVWHNNAFNIDAHKYGI